MYLSCIKEHEYEQFILSSSNNKKSCIIGLQINMNMNENIML